jgi:AcrR family transcriptional regulator
MSGVPGSAVDGRSARWESHREERRRALIKAARRAVHQLGADAPMEDIANHAGTSKSVFYRYFGDKSGLQQAVGDVVIGQMRDTIVAARRSARTPREGLVNMVSAYLEMAETSPNVYIFVTADAEQSSGALGGFFDAVTAMISEPLREMLGDTASPLLRFWPSAAIGLVRSTGELWLKAEAAPDKPGHTEMAAQIATWLFDGVREQLQTPDSPSP